MLTCLVTIRLSGVVSSVKSDCVIIKTQNVTVIAGEDNAGWTLDDYVIPRLASGLYVGKEIDLSHPVMKLIPDENHIILDDNMAPCPRCGKSCRVEKFGTWTAHCSRCMQGFKVDTPMFEVVGELTYDADTDKLTYPW